MVTLSCKVGERIVVDESITLTVTRIRGGTVWLGIAAPPGRADVTGGPPPSHGRLEDRDASWRPGRN